MPAIDFNNFHEELMRTTSAVTAAAAAKPAIALPVECVISAARATTEAIKPNFKRLFIKEKVCLNWIRECKRLPSLCPVANWDGLVYRSFLKIQSPVAKSKSSDARIVIW